MAIERRRYGPAPSPSSSTSLADLVDRILDKGLVIDAWVRISLVGIELATIEARIVVASVDTYLKYAEAIAQTALAAEPHAYRRAVQSAPSDDEVAAYLNDHAEGVGLDDVARFFDVSREELKPVLQRLTTGPRVRVDHGRLIPTDASNGSNGSRRQGKLSARVTDDGDGAGADDAAETEDDSDEAKDRAKDRSHAAKQRR